MEHTLTGSIIIFSPGIFRFRGRSFIVRQIAQVLHIERLVTPEDGIECILLFIRVGVHIIRQEVINCRIGNRLVFHKVAVNDTRSRLRRDREHTTESLTSIGIRNLIGTLHLNRIETASRLIVIKQRIGDIAAGIGSDTAAGGPRDKLGVQRVHRSLAVILGEMAAPHIDTAVGVESTAVTRHIIIEYAVLYDNRNIVWRRFGHIRHGSIVQFRAP